MAVEQTLALQNATINAVTLRQMLQALTPNGGGVVPGTVGASYVNGAPVDLLVAQQSTANMSVQVNPGQIFMPGTQLSAPTTQFNWTTQGVYYALNDASVTVTISAADPVNPRIDAVYIAVQDSFYSGSSNGSVIGVVTGTPASTPAAPSIPVNGILLGYVNVAANATSIVNANITDKRILAIGARTGCRVVTNVAQAVAASTVTTWNNNGTAAWTLADGMSSFASGAGGTTTPIVVPAGMGGLYLVGLSVNMSAIASSRAFAELRINGAASTNSGRGVFTGDTTAAYSVPINLNAGDSVGAQVFTTTACNLNASYIFAYRLSA